MEPDTQASIVPATEKGLKHSLVVTALGPYIVDCYFFCQLFHSYVAPSSNSTMGEFGVFLLTFFFLLSSVTIAQALFLFRQYASVSFLQTVSLGNRCFLRVA